LKEACLNFLWVDEMKKASLITATTLAAVLTLAGCSGMTQRDKNTAVGAGIGAVAGSVLTNGSGIGTIGGAAVGGVIGNQVGGKRR
jgi:osmotically inducible lipoprotein OsmB